MLITLEEEEKVFKFFCIYEENQTFQKEPGFTRNLLFSLVVDLTRSCKHLDAILITTLPYTLLSMYVVVSWN